MTDTQLLDFGSLRIAFDDRVLRPRKWTADQSRWSAALLSQVPAGPVLELCAGAGQIGLLAVAESDRDLVCVDLSPVACDYARRNADAAGMADRVEVREGALASVVRDDERFALVIADPPWVRRSDIGRYPEDPELAIDGGDDGLDIARDCLEVAAGHLLPGGSVVLQVGTAGQVELLRPVIGETGLELVEVRQGERGVLARLDLR